MRIDPHTHSTASDGTSTPAQLVAESIGAGLDVVGITDHDTTDGWDQAAAAAARMGIGLLRGVELSATTRGIPVHILGFLPDPGHEPLQAEFAAIRESRVTRAQRTAELVARDFPITWPDVLAQVGPDATVGRPHIADALVVAGVFPDRNTAFAEVLYQDGPYYVDYYSPDAADAVQLILAAGGVPVFAHPGAHNRGRIVPDETYWELAAAGLAGIEVYHRDHDDEQYPRLSRIARHLDLFVTGASDYHGAGKPNRLGENLTAPSVLAAIAERGAIEVLLP